jgi:hypothetical protein
VIARTSLLLLAMLVLVACGSAASSSETTVRVTVSSGNDNAPPTAPASYGTMRVAFREVVSSPGCFFFSGPGELGRDDRLGEHAELDAERLRFSPTIELTRVELPDGSVTWSRESIHEFGGPWRVREAITLLPSGAGWVGRYRYQELSPGATTPGTCTIDARVELWPGVP